MKMMTPASGLPSAGSAKAEAACGDQTPTPRAAPSRLQRQKSTGDPRNNDSWLVAKNEVAQWVSKLDIMEDKIKKREANFKKFRAHLEAARKYAVDFTNPVKWHKEMVAELPWPVRHGCALSDRQVAVNVQAHTLTKHLMAVTQQVVQSEAVVRQLEAERSALFVSVEDHCLEELESILEEYSACLTYAPTR